MKRKKVNGRPGKTNELLLKTEADLREGPDNINIQPWIMFSFNWLVIISREEGVVWNLTSNFERVYDYWMQINKRGGGSWKLDNFHGRHMCIIPKKKVCFYIFWNAGNRTETLRIIMLFHFKENSAN